MYEIDLFGISLAKKMFKYILSIIADRKTEYSENHNKMLEFDFSRRERLQRKIFTVLLVLPNFLSNIYINGSKVILVNKIMQQKRS